MTIGKCNYLFPILPEEMVSSKVCLSKEKDKTQHNKRGSKLVCVHSSLFFFFRTYQTPNLVLSSKLTGTTFSRLSLNSPRSHLH